MGAAFFATTFVPVVVPAGRWGACDGSTARRGRDGATGAASPSAGSAAIGDEGAALGAVWTSDAGSGVRAEVGSGTG
ncbi:hypothetical protein [Streptomyces lydicus]|uniref:hypothetical protein n=1 Tax=Streptomyces lydicus TaxID=47763 RepID=UPI00342EE58A